LKYDSSSASPSGSDQIEHLSSTHDQTALREQPALGAVIQSHPHGLCPDPDLHVGLRIE
jgi:hypothetical protein